jgi:hypothetical protein
MKGITEWLASIGLSEYAQRFADNAIDLSVIRDLTEQDLKDLGVLLGHRRKILRAIAQLDGVASAPTATVTEPAFRDEAERRHPRAGEPLAVRIGIATGVVVIGDLSREGLGSQSIFSGTDGSRVHRVCQSQSGEDQYGLSRARERTTSLYRVV